MDDQPLQPEHRPYPPAPPADPRFERPGHDPYAAAFGQVSDPKTAKKRLLVPGLFIILLGVLNLLPGGGCSAVGLLMASIPDTDLEQMAKQSDPKQWDELQRQGHGVGTLKAIYLWGGLGCGLGSLVAALAAFVGGGCMIAGRSLLLCSLGALAAIFSPGGFGLLGLGIGIWAFVVLFREDVRAAFRGA